MTKYSVNKIKVFLIEVVNRKRRGDKGRKEDEEISSLLSSHQLILREVHLSHPLQAHHVQALR